MFLKPAKLGEKEIPEKILSEDRKHCKKIGPCGIGKEALYLNSFYLERRYYVPVSSVSRVFKRVAMSKGGFTGKGLFATMPYLVVVLDDGSEKQCNFKYEDQVDAFVSAVKERFPQVKTVSEAAEKRLAEALGFTDERQRIVETPMGSRVIRRELLAHMVEKRPDARERFANYVLPTLTQPFEVWLKQHEDGTLRENYIGLFRETKYSLLVVVRINRDGSLVWNIMQREDKKMDKHREGMLVYKKKS
mgnify:CR=1 FL=1